MDDRSESKHASSKTKQKFFTSRNPLELSSDSSSDDIVNVVKTQSKHDVPGIEQPGSKQSKSFTSRLWNWITGGDSNTIKFAGANLKLPDIQGPTEQHSDDKPSDGHTKTCNRDRLDEAAQPTIEQNYEEEYFDCNNRSSRDDANNDKGINGGMQKKDTTIKAFVVTEEIGSLAVFCNQCDEAATSYCDTCKLKLCIFCHEAHTRQSVTQNHILTDIEKVKLSNLNMTCSTCKEHADKFCPECILRLCTKCAWVHHKLSDIKTTLQQHCGDKRSDKESNKRNQKTLDEKNAVTSGDNSKKLSNESTQPTSASSAPDALNGVQKKTNCICDLCEETAVSFCEECKLQLGHFCTEAHKKQKRTKEHNLQAIETAKPSIRNGSCKFCAGIAGKFCPDCDIRMCIKCSNVHHKLSDTLTLTTQTTRQCGKKPSTEENVPDPALPFGEGPAPIIKTKSCYSSVDISAGHGRKGDTPGKPTVDAIYTDSVDILWAGVDVFCEGDVYQVRTENIIKTNKWLDQTIKKNNCKITGLEPGASYTFKVRLVKANGEESIYSDKSEEVTTHRSFASELVRTLSPVKANREGPDIFALPLQENMQARDDKAMTKKYDIGSRTKEDNEKTIMFVGATGTGKSTLVDGLANYLMGVKLGDKFRFTLMEEENKEKQHNQAVSQTDWITTYSFNPEPGSRLKYRLNVIDTPGFGDTRGLERDQQILNQIRHLFDATGETGVQTIDAVCFFIKAPDSRFTATQTYMFNAIMSLYGKYIEGNICTLITFADVSDPPVLHAVYESRLPFGKTFTFNNSALFSNPSNPFTSMFWDMGLHSFEAVIAHINLLERSSIKLTMVERIDILIQAETHERKLGYLGRIEVLQQFRDRAIIGKSVKTFKQKAFFSTS